MSLGIDDFLLTQIEPLKARIAAYILASSELASGAIQSYELESGQTRQKVTKANIDLLEQAISAAMNQLTTLEARLCGTGTIRVIPSF
jgi:hypothetical protein